jgi:transcriptional regulator GlxA family with amidase domain
MSQVVENAAREQLFDGFSPERAPESETRLAVEPRLSRDGSLVAQALERLRTDPSVSRGELAEGLGVSPSKLGKAFRAQMGVAFVDYRNQLRLERFLKLVFPGGGNVSQAAKSAGFGSYAQFHRVFRALVGKSPKEYLKQQTVAS